MHNLGEGHCGCVSPRWTTVTVMGVPFLICSKCGKGLPKMVIEKTHTKKEMREDWQKKREKPLSKEEELKKIIEEVWERKYGNNR